MKSTIHQLIKVLSIVSLLTSGHSGAFSQNLITNGDFSNGTFGWNPVGNDSNGGWRSTGGNPDEFFIINASGHPATDPSIAQTISCLIPGQMYTLSGDYREWYNCCGSPGPALAFDLDGVEQTTWDNPGTTWTPFSYTFTVTASTQVIRFRSEINGTDTEIAIDNITFVAVNPSSNVEICDGIDNDCDGEIDEGFDQDEDGYTTCQSDCDDTNAAVKPSAMEVCDGIDNNCDGQIDEGFDQDGDGFTSCDGDCDDNDSSINPNAIDICDGIDNNCDGDIDEDFDQDEDGYTCGDDCDDTNPAINPDAEEICDGQDNDCNGLIDDGPDGDGDGSPDICDNCPATPNPDQSDADCDGVGDACDQWPGCDDTLDSDNDGTPDCVDLDVLADWPCGNNGNKVTICHVPPGNPANRHEICVSPNAVPAHLGHGDYIGECDQQSCSNNGLPISPSSSVADHETDFGLYPNPASSSINLDLHHFVGQEVSISITNHLGQRVLYLPEQEVHDHSITIELSEQQLPNGMYLLTVRTAEGRQAKQFVIAR